MRTDSRSQSNPESDRLTGGVFARWSRGEPARMASEVQVGVRVRGNGGNRVAVGTERRVRDTIILIALVASPSIGILLLGLAK